MTESATPPPGPRVSLRRRDAVAIIVGIVVGAGIFRAPSLVADIARDPGWALALWIAGGAISLVGALCYAELASAHPHAGGDYHFLTRAFGRDVSFLYGWARATVINTGSIALLAFVFGDYASRIVDAGPHSSAIWAAALVVALTVVNVASLAASARTQNWLTVVEVAGLLFVIAAGVAATPEAASGAAWFATSPPAGAIGLALVFVLLTYGGWNEAAYLSAELPGGARTILWTLVASVLIIMALYVATNAALLGALGVAGLSASKAAAADVVTRAFGRAAGDLLSAFVAVATLTSINATMLTGARTNYALANDWAPLRHFAGWNVRRGVPTRGFLLQSSIALALIAFGATQKDGFEAMVEFTAPVFWGFLALVGVALVLLRQRFPEAPRPFRVPLYPLTPLAFIATCAFLFHSSITYAASRGAIHVSLYVMAVGAAAWALTRLRSATTSSARGR
ncbi:MAG: amino acid permease [Burkholderiales bacterium]